MRLAVAICDELTDLPAVTTEWGAWLEREVCVIAEKLANMKLVPGREPPDFSLVRGGPLFQLYRRAHLSGDALELLLRRVILVTLLAWLPLLVLSVVEGHALAGAARIPFLYDIEAHVRFLIALPFLIVAEVIVHSRIAPLARWLVERRIVSKEDLPRFNAALNGALRIRNSIAVELTLLLLAYTLGLWAWWNRIALRADTWYVVPGTAHLHLSLAGYWYAFVSIPIFQFLLLRWYMRLGLWFRFLWQVSRMDLRLTAAHPDRAGGIGFLGENSYAFAPILFAEGALLAGFIANRVLYDGQKLLSFKTEAVGLVVLAVLVVLGPLIMFTPQLERTRWAGSGRFGALANRYAFGFEEKWLQGSAPESKSLLGTPDLQSLADLGTSYSVVEEMRIIPFGLRQVGQLAAATAAPLLPLVFTRISFDEFLIRLVKIFF